MILEGAPCLMPCRPGTCGGVGVSMQVIRSSVPVVSGSSGPSGLWMKMWEARHRERVS